MVAVRDLAEARGRVVASSGSGQVASAASRGGPTRVGRGDRTAKSSEPVPFYRWLTAQRFHSDPAVRAAVAHIADRWPVNDRYSHSVVIRDLSREDSPHAVAARQLADEYADLLGLDDAGRHALSGISGPWFPFAPERCECGREAVPGTGACARHGGQWVTEEDRELASRAIRDRMEGLAFRAVRTLEDLMDSARSEKVRLEAAVAVLDRVGIGATQTLRIEDGSEDPDGPAARVRERLETLSVIVGQVVEDVEASLDGPGPE